MHQHEFMHLMGKVVRNMVTNCRGNPPWLPFLRAAKGGRPYNILFGSGLSGSGF